MQRRQKRPDLTTAESVEIVRRLKEGETVLQIARSIDRHPGNVYSLLRRRYGIEFGGGGASWPQQIRVPTEVVDIAYMAGIVDGEGCIHRRSADRNWSLQVAMTSRPVIDWLMSFGGGHVHLTHKERDRPVHTWTLQRRRDLVALLPVLIPHLRVPEKRTRAQEALADMVTRENGVPVHSAAGSLLRRSS